MIGILDYGLGNIRAFANAYERLGIKYRYVNSDEVHFDDLDGIILPGVGSFDDAMIRLRTSAFYSGVVKTIEEGKPVLGVCVGMQMLFRSSDEGREAGLSFLNGHVKRLPEHKDLRLPHLGPNLIEVLKENPLLQGISDQEFYFLHSYYCLPDSEADILCFSNHGLKFPCVVNKENIYGVQFHPEKSHDSGEALLLNFARICGCGE